MDSKETLFKTEAQRTLLHNDEYFKYIFKKTEKIVCAVLYTLRSNPDIRHDDLLVRGLEAASEKLMDAVHATLRATSGSRSLRLEDLRTALIALESRLSMSAAGGIIARELLEVFQQELFALTRSLKRYTDEDTFTLMSESEVRLPEVRRIREKRSEPRTPMSVDAQRSTTPGKNRRERVLDVIRDKHEATIKDISELITDCSEKTIQRELIDLIKDGLIVREGERRWSKYKLV